MNSQPGEGNNKISKIYTISKANHIRQSRNFGTQHKPPHEIQHGTKPVWPPHTGLSEDAKRLSYNLLMMAEYELWW